MTGGELNLNRGSNFHSINYLKIMPVWQLSGIGLAVGLRTGKMVLLMYNYTLDIQCPLKTFRLQKELK